MVSRRLAVRVLRKIGEAAGEAPKSLAVCVEASTGDPFRVLVATLLSLRNRDEVTGPAAKRVLSKWPTPAALAMADDSELGEAVRPSNLWRSKVRALKEVSLDVVNRGGVPSTVDGLLSIKWIGRKTANLVATLGYGTEGLCVDTHVHRISNRLGLVSTRRPSETEASLRSLLPKTIWKDVNDWLVWHGRTTCLPISPKCSLCVVRRLCVSSSVGDGS